MVATSRFEDVAQHAQVSRDLIAAQISIGALQDRGKVMVTDGAFDWP